MRSAGKNKTGTTLWTTKKNFQDEEFPQDLFLTERQKTRFINPFANNISADIKLSKAQFF